METYKINFTSSLEDIESVKFHPLTKNGPYLDAHFGPLNKETPVGQTYFIRPVCEYIPPCKHGLKHGCGCGGKGEGHLIIKVSDCFPAIHANTNSVSKDFSISGRIKIAPFEWDGEVAKNFPNQVLSINVTVKNKTGLKMQGFHIHDGQNKKGLTSFGEISYFLYTTSTWNKVYNQTRKSIEFAKKYAPLPPNNIALKKPTPLLNYSKSIKIEYKD
jgi:hypothetical protein